MQATLLCFFMKYITKQDLRKKLQSLSFSITFIPLLLKVGGIVRREAKHFECFRWKTFSYSKDSSVPGLPWILLQNYPRNVATMGPCSLSLSLCWILREPSDMISKPRIFCSKITGENAINFLLPCFQERTSLMLFLRFF